MRAYNERTGSEVKAQGRYAEDTAVVCSTVANKIIVSKPTRRADVCIYSPSAFITARVDQSAV